MMIFRPRYSLVYNVRLIRGPQPLHPWDWPEHPWSRIHIDYAGPIRNRYLLVVIDLYSKRLDVAVVPSANSTQFRVYGTFLQHTGYLK